MLVPTNGKARSLTIYSADTKYLCHVRNVQCKRTVKAVLTRLSDPELGHALVAEAVANVGEEELAFGFG
jgi:hypothetical protein